MQLSCGRRVDGLDEHALMSRLDVTKAGAELVGERPEGLGVLAGARRL